MICLIVTIPTPIAMANLVMLLVTNLVMLLVTNPVTNLVMLLVTNLVTIPMLAIPMLVIPMGALLVLTWGLRPCPLPHP